MGCNSNHASICPTLGLKLRIRFLKNDLSLCSELVPLMWNCVPVSGVSTGNADSNTLFCHFNVDGILFASTFWLFCFSLPHDPFIKGILDASDFFTYHLQTGILLKIYQDSCFPSYRLWTHLDRKFGKAGSFGDLRFSVCVFSSWLCHKRHFWVEGRNTAGISVLLDSQTGSWLDINCIFLGIEWE